MYVAVVQYEGSRKSIASALSLLSTLLLVVSLLTPFSSITVSESPDTSSTLFLPGNQFQVTCSGPYCTNSEVSQAYGQATGDLYRIVWCLLGLGVLASLGAAVQPYLSLRRKASPLLRWILLTSGATAALVAPVLALAVQPGAIYSDQSSSGYNNPFPWPCGAEPTSVCQSFWGTSGDGTLTWAAGLGWYAAVAAAILLALALVLTRLPRDDPRLKEVVLIAITLSLGTLLLALFYTVVWRAVPPLFGILGFPLLICILALSSYLYQKAETKYKRALASGWTPS